MNPVIKFQLKTLSRSRDIMILIYKNLSRLIEIVHQSAPCGVLLLHKKGVLLFISVERILCKIPLKN